MPLRQRTYKTDANDNAKDDITPLVGWQYEYLPWDAEVEIAVKADDSGFRYQCYSGSDLLAQDEQPSIATSPEEIQYPFDYNLQDIAAEGERIGLTIKPGSLNAKTITVAVRVTPL